MELYDYEIVYCTGEKETVTRKFQSLHGDLTSEDDRCPYAIGSSEYLRLVD